MKLTFDMMDEKTVTNDTIKVTATIDGLVQGDTKEVIEESIQAAMKELLPDADWAFSNFTFYRRNFPMYSVKASARVLASHDDGLVDRAEKLTTDKLAIAIENIDHSIPAHRFKEAESELRETLLLRATAEAKKLSEIYGQSLEVDSIRFGAPTVSQPIRMASASYLESSVSAKGGGLGHSEKTVLSAKVVLKTEKTNNSYILPKDVDDFC